MLRWYQTTSKPDTHRTAPPQTRSSHRVSYRTTNFRGPGFWASRGRWFQRCLRMSHSLTYLGARRMRGAGWMGWNASALFASRVLQYSTVCGRLRSEWRMGSKGKGKDRDREDLDILFYRRHDMVVSGEARESEVVVGFPHADCCQPNPTRPM